MRAGTLKSEALMLASSVFLGFGGSLNTVGLSIWAGDLSTPERYEKTLRLFQGAYGLGGMLSSPARRLPSEVFTVMLVFCLFGTPTVWPDRKFSMAERECGWPCGSSALT